MPHTVCAFDVQAILLSPKFHCTEEMLTIVSLLSVDSVLCNPPSRRDEVQAVRRKFVSSEGDHVTLLNVYRAFRNAGGSKVGLASPPNPPPSRLDRSTRPFLSGRISRGAARTEPGADAPAHGGRRASVLLLLNWCSEGASSPCLVTALLSHKCVFPACP